ncbi:PREDICTED: uncharacterized protein LOC109212790, partial [Nicotiana attenuata]|uniref:uncharacterized protein LOC109212790 n=1 Tax=Nicotiana attenuata TaxID=49451 RepID=UPI0009049955
MDLLREYDCLQQPPLSSPLDHSLKLKADHGVPLKDPTQYGKLVGKLNFLTNTRCLKGDPNLEMFLSDNTDYKIYAFCDLDLVACSESRKSVSGYLILLGGCPVSWKSEKQSTIALSSAEAEYMSTRVVVGELVWLVKLFEELAVPLSFPIP